MASAGVQINGALGASRGTAPRGVSEGTGPLKPTWFLCLKQYFSMDPLQFCMKWCIICILTP